MLCINKRLYRTDRTYGSYGCNGRNRRDGTHRSYGCYGRNGRNGTYRTYGCNGSRRSDGTYRTDRTYGTCRHGNRRGCRDRRYEHGRRRDAV